ncbi:MAG: GNAT family N-acetyltransferase [Nocardioidaceae bacterium]
MIDWQIRPAGYDDWRAAANVWLSARHANVPSIPPAAGTDDQVRAWMRDVVFAHREVWLAFDGDTAVGLLVLDAEWLDELYVVPGRTREGIGTALLDLAKHRRSGGFGLWVSASNVGARRFYQRHGLQAVGRSDQHEHDTDADLQYSWSPAASSSSSPDSGIATAQDQ